MLPYGIVGNCKTCALIKKDGSVDWLCHPDFSSPSIFARILDKKRGGSLRITPQGKYRVEQGYAPDTAVLETTFTSEKEAFKVTDFFPRYRKLVTKKHAKLYKQNRLYRIITPLKGKPKLKIIYDPRPDYGRREGEWKAEEGEILTTSQFSLNTNIPLETIRKKEAFELKRTAYLVLGTPREERRFSVAYCTAILRATKAYWKRWVNSLVLPEEYRERIVRSAITLKLLTYSETGAIIAAATTSIPEEIGKPRTWDYRYCWVRDAALCVDALKRIGRNYESKKLLEFFLSLILKHKKLQIMYGIHGEESLEEEELPHLAGFKETRPVRIGNAAYAQRQLDIYGYLIDILWLYYGYYKYEERMPAKYWRLLKYLVSQIRKEWKKKDSGIWEFRERRAHYTHSKMMCLVGLERAVKLAQEQGKQELVDKWVWECDELRNHLLRKGYNERAKSFTISEEERDLDASLLLLAYYEVLPPTDPRLVNTIHAIDEKLRHGPFVQRYAIRDDIGKSGSAFTICSFWLVHALHYIGEEERARRLYEEITKHANHLGLFSEDIDVKKGELLGNFPQAYTHIALITTSLLLSEWRSHRRELPRRPEGKRRRRVI